MQTPETIRKALRGVKDPAALRAGLADVEGVHVFDQESMMAAASLDPRNDKPVIPASLPVV